MWSPSREGEGPMYWFLMKYVFLGPVLRLLFRPKVSGLENIPTEGPAILAANHQSFVDDLPLRHHPGEQQVVEEGLVGRREDGGTLRGDVLQAAHLGPEQQPKDGAEEDVFHEEPVHGTFPLPAWTPHPGVRLLHTRLHIAVQEGNYPVHARVREARMVVRGRARHPGGGGGPVLHVPRPSAVPGPLPALMPTSPPTGHRESHP